MKNDKDLEEDCVYLVQRLLQEFPGLIDHINGSESEVNGSDLVDFLTQQIDELNEIKKQYLTKDFGK